MRHPAPASSYVARRAWLEEYFDRTAAATWARLTSDEPVGRIRSSVRAGRERMRAVLLGWLPRNMVGQRVLDAGCGTGLLATDLGRRGGEVEAVDLSATLIQLAQERLPAALAGRVRFRAGDMLDSALGSFDHVVAMDSLIHYEADDMVGMLGQLAARAKTTVVFTFAPWTPMLAALHAVGTLLPRANRAPQIAPVAEAELRKGIDSHPELAGWRVGRCERVQSGFYTSQAMELVKNGRRETGDGRRGERETGDGRRGERETGDGRRETSPTQ